MDKLLFKGKKLIERIPGKGGWTFIALPEVAENIDGKISMIKVKGKVDDCAIYSIHLMPKADGMLILPLNEYVRKQIGKRKGDVALVEIYEDHDDTPIPDELMECLEAEPECFEYFMSLSTSIKRNVIQYIYQAKKQETRDSRIMMYLRRMRVRDIENYSIK